MQAHLLVPTYFCWKFRAFTIDNSHASPSFVPAKYTWAQNILLVCYFVSWRMWLFENELRGGSSTGVRKFVLICSDRMITKWFYLDIWYMNLEFPSLVWTSVLAAKRTIYTAWHIWEMTRDATYILFLSVFATSIWIRS